MYVLTFIEVSLKDRALAAILEEHVGLVEGCIRDNKISLIIR